MRRGRPRVHFDLHLAERMQAQGASLASIARTVGVSPRTLQRALLKTRQNSAKVSVAVGQTNREPHDAARFLAGSLCSKLMPFLRAAWSLIRPAQHLGRLGESSGTTQPTRSSAAEIQRLRFSLSIFVMI